MDTRRGLWVLSASMILFSLLVALFFTPAPIAEAACPTLPTDKGTVGTSISVGSSGTYYVWSRNRTASKNRDSYYLKVDTNCGVVVGGDELAENSWTWVNHKNGNSGDRIEVDLNSGSHTFKLHGLEPSVQVDRLLITKDANCVPTNAGDNCTGETTPTTKEDQEQNGREQQSTAPTTIDASTPDNQKISGTIQAGSADTPETKTIIKVDGEIVASGYGLVSIDTTRLTNGFHDITIENIYADGTTETTTKRIFVDNPLNEFELVYNWLFQALNYNQRITQAVMFLSAAVLCGAVAITCLKLWRFRFWERLPLVKKIHIPFLRRPDFSHLFATHKTISQSSSASGTMVYGNFETGPQINHIVIDIHGRQLTLNLPAIFVTIVFSIVGATIVLLTFAQPITRTIDPENGTRSGVVTLNDSSAAGGSYIQFGTGTTAKCPSGQTGTPPNCKTPPKQFTSKCLQRTGTTVTLSGLQKAGYRNQPLKPNTIINAKNAYWDGLSSYGNPIAWLAKFEGSGPGCWFGGKYQGVWDDTSPNVTWENPYHHAGIATIQSPGFLIEGIRADNNGDGMRVEKPGDNFHVRGVWVSNMHDDCFENDHMLGGVVEDSFFDGCYAGVSMDNKSPALNGSKNTVTFKDNLLWMKPMNTVFRGEAPGTAMLFKGWSSNRSVPPAMVITNNIFRIDKKAGFEQHKLPPNMNLKTCSNNTIVWTGAGDFPYSQYFPSCFKITKDLNVWINAVKKWKDEHSNVF